MAKSRAEKLAESTTFHPSWGSSKQTSDQGFTSSTGYTSIDYQSGQSEDPYKFARTRKMPRDVHPDVFVTPAWGSQIHQGSAFGEQPTWGSGIDYDPSKRHTIKDVTPGEERPSFLKTTALPDATDTSTEVTSEAISNWKVNAEKALQDMIKIEETDPSSRIQSVTPDPEPQVADEGVVSQEESESMIAASKQGTHSKVNINNIIAIGAHGTLKSTRHPDEYRGGEGADIIEGALSTFLREPSANVNAQGEVTSYNTPRLLDYGGLRMSGPEFMDTSVENPSTLRSSTSTDKTIPTTSVIMPHGITDEGESINYSGLYRGKGREGQVGTDTIWISERADHGGLIDTDPKHPGDTAYHEPMHRFFHYLWRDYYDNEGKLSKGIKVKDSENKEVELLDAIFPKKDSNCNAKTCARNWNGKAMHDIIYSASKYGDMRKRVGSEEFGEQTDMTETANLKRNWDNLKKINNAMSYEAKRIMNLKNLPAPEWVDPDA